MGQTIKFSVHRNPLKDADGNDTYQVRHETTFTVGKQFIKDHLERHHAGTYRTDKVYGPQVARPAFHANIPLPRWPKGRPNSDLPTPLLNMSTDQPTQCRPSLNVMPFVGGT